MAQRNVKQRRILLVMLFAVLLGSAGYIFTTVRSSEVKLNNVVGVPAQPTVWKNKKQLVAAVEPSSIPFTPETSEKKPRPPMPAISIPKGVSGEEAIKALGNNMAAVAAFYGKTENELVELFRNDDSAKLDAKGHIYFVDPASNKTKSKSAQQSSTPSRSEQVNTAAASSVPLDQIFLLHSKSSSKVIYLDFNGHDATSSAWNENNTSLIAKSYDNDGNPNSFSTAEKEEIYYIWTLVADAYAPFNIDVTTEDPGTAGLTRSNINDTAFGVRAVITTDETLRNRVCNLSCVGISYIQVFDQVDANDQYEPSWIFNDLPNEMYGLDIENYIASTVIHEAGHAFGLHHDGLSNPVQNYYDGHNGWVPIMGRNMGINGVAGVFTQWSKGEYTNANNQEDDLAIIAANDGVGYSTDDFGNTLALATMNSSSLTDPEGIEYYGIIENATDVDFVSFNVGTTTPVKVSLSASYGLHAGFSLFNSSDTLLSTSESKYAASVGTIQQTLSPGVYKVRVRGKSSGNPLTDGYSTYGSVSGYFVQIIDASSPTPTATPTPTACPTSGCSTPTPTSTPVPLDTDHDGKIDSIDTDDDNDGVLDVNDAFPLDKNESVDSDGDGTGNNADTDDDNDGIDDQFDSRPLDSSLQGVNGAAATDAFGTSVAYVGDVNSDGFGDYIVGAHLHNVGVLADAGYAQLISGKTGQTLFTFNGDKAKEYFGFAVAGVGDVNGDGIPDVAIGAYLDDPTVANVKLTDAGSVTVFSGANGSRLYQVTGTSAKEYFGYSVAGIHDVDGDDQADIVVGAPLGDKPNPAVKDTGKIQIFTGVTGTLYRTYYGDTAGDYLGASVAYAGDINKDNFGDVIAGAPLGDVKNPTTLKLLKDAGYARVYSPNTDTVLNPVGTLIGGLAGDNFGSSVSGAGDVDNDGMDDVIIGANKADVVSTITFKLIKDAGRATIQSSANWEEGVLHQFAGTIAADYVGSSVAGVGDINDDGFDDVAIGAYGFDAPIINSTKKLSSAGKATIYSGQDNSELFSVFGTGATDYLGWSLSAGDMNNDDVPDVLVGVPKDDVVNNNLLVKDAGSVTVISGAAALP